jgi:hypothetical protein
MVLSIYHVDVPQMKHAHSLQHQHEKHCAARQIGLHRKTSLAIHDIDSSAET